MYVFTAPRHLRLSVFQTSARSPEAFNHVNKHENISILQTQKQSRLFKSSADLPLSFVPSQTIAVPRTPSSGPPRQRGPQTESGFRCENKKTTFLRAEVGRAERKSVTSKSLKRGRGENVRKSVVRHWLCRTGFQAFRPSPSAPGRPLG